MKALPQSLIPLHLADAAAPASDPADETHPLAEKLRQALAAPGSASIGNFAGIIQALHAELKMASPELIEAIAAECADAAAAAPPADTQGAITGLIAQMELDDEPGKPQPV
jgi:hypothetical protein